MPEMSASTGAPAALARSEGWKVETNGMAQAAAPMAPTAEAVTSALRRDESLSSSCSKDKLEG